MSENNKIGTYNFVAEPFHVDFTGRLTLGVLGNHLLNCAGFHATERGFGMAELNEENYTWVLSRLAIDMDEMPLQYESFSIQTWVENVYRLFTDRNFAILDKDGRKAYRRKIRIGRQNPQYYEVLEGLEPGEQVIVSGYEGYKNNEILILE